MGMGPTIGNRTVVARENGKWLEDPREVDERVWLGVLKVDRLLSEQGLTE